MTKAKVSPAESLANMISEAAGQDSVHKQDLQSNNTKSPTYLRAKSDRYFIRSMGESILSIPAGLTAYASHIEGREGAAMWFGVAAAALALDGLAKYRLHKEYEKTAEYYANNPTEQFSDEPHLLMQEEHMYDGI